MQTLGSLLAAGLFCVVTVWLDLPLLAQWPCEGGSPKVLFSAHPLESCLNDPLILECKVGPFLLDPRAGGLALVPPLPQGKVWAIVLALPHRAPEHIWVNFWDILRYKPRLFCSLLHAAALGKNLVTLTCSLLAGLLHLNSGDPAIVEGRDVGEEASCLS